MHWANHSAESLNHWSWSWSSNKNTTTTNEKNNIRFHLVVMESCMSVIAARFHTIWIIVNGTSGIGSNLLKKRFPFDLSFVSFIVFFSIYSHAANTVLDTRHTCTSMNAHISCPMRVWVWEWDCICVCIFQNASGPNHCQSDHINSAIVDLYQQ